MSRIKVLFTIPNFDTAGSGKVVYDLVNNIDTKKFEPHICCRNKKGSFFKEVEKLNVPIHIFDITEPRSPIITYLFRINRIVGFLKSNKFDIVHSWNWSSDFSEPLAARLAGVKYIYTKKAMSWGSPKSWKLRSFLSHAIIVLNSDMVPRFFSKMKNKTHLIYLGVDLKKFAVQKKTRKVGDFEFSKSDFVIVSIANLVPIKGIEYLMEGVNLLENPDIKLLIVGNNKNEYGQKLIANNNNKNIHFIDKVLDIKPYHAVADVFVIPTKTSWEGMPVAPIEAMASGCVVIGSEVEGVREVLQNHKDCMFPKKNSKAIAEKLEWIIKMDASDKIKLEHSMRNEVVNLFDFDRCMHAHEKLYSQIVNKN
jgi:glycosyltransferase involved in cell wall biosynthesis